ncbi:PREDICTED: vicilin-like seed storage protein At2g18540 [Tarenaya hassleriana]|uniref:vicilin-like seed storage protein At2g18540 n=1 Tax=Tarenaya hassleriana TaxID=28532 RepID=UPI00053C11B4|nr:PREDICTED: vicilin-like seed storage protein At2g18540 [Tarenaya hassleriana]
MPNRTKHRAQKMKKFTILPLSVLLLLTLLISSEASVQNDAVACGLPVVRKDQRTRIVETEFGEISAVEISDGCGIRGTHSIHFITLEPNSLLLPLLLHSDMVFFVHTGSGVLTWVDEDKETRIEIRRGDVYRLRPGTVFYVRSNLEREIREKLRVYAIFSDTSEDDYIYDPCLGPYSSIRELLLGFDERTLRSAFAVPEEVIGTIRNATKPPLIVHGMPKNITHGSDEFLWQIQSRFLRIFVREEDSDELIINSRVKKKKTRTYNVFEEDPDFENCNGRSITVSKKDLHALKGSSVGVFMVNLTKGSMVGPHWNPRACEISIVLRGEGMIRVVSSSNEMMKQSKCKSGGRFMVGEGDVFAVPRFHPMAQMSFNNGSFVFVGFSTSARRNYPRFLAGKSSVLQVLKREIMAVALNVSNVTVDRLLGGQEDGVMLECTSCAEEELVKLKEEIQREKEEEERKKREKEEEAARRREEEEARKREEERQRKEREEAERKRREEEEKRRQQEEAERERREEEEMKRREEERERKEREEEERRRQEEMERERREEERKREEEAAKREEEERQKKEREEAERQRQEQEEAERRRRQQEEERKREEEAAKREERERQEQEEAERQRRQEQEAAERQRREQEEEERQRKQEEERKREEEAAKREEAERQRKEREEAERQRQGQEEAERQRRQEEEEEKRRKEEAAAEREPKPSPMEEQNP